MSELPSDILGERNKGEISSSERNDDALRYLEGSITTGSPVTLGPISEAPIQPPQYRNQGYSGGNDHIQQYSSRTEFFGGNKIVGNSGIKDLGWVGAGNTPRAVSTTTPTPTPAPYVEVDGERTTNGMEMAGYKNLHLDANDQYWTKDIKGSWERVDSSKIDTYRDESQYTQDDTKTEMTPGTPRTSNNRKDSSGAANRQETGPSQQTTTPAQTETPSSNTDSPDIPTEHQQMFTNSDGVGMRWNSENKTWKSMRDIGTADEAQKTAEKWNQTEPNNPHNKSARAAGYKYVAEGLRVVLRKN